MNVLFDSDVLIHHFRSRRGLATLEGAIRRSNAYFSSVAAMELKAGCRTKDDLRTLRQFMRPFEDAGRVVAPTHRIFRRAGEVLAELGSRFDADVRQRRRLANDVLIALSAASIGAAVITHNRADFELIAQCVPLVWFGSAVEFPTATD